MLRRQGYLLLFLLLVGGVGMARADDGEDKPISLKKPVDAPITRSFGPAYHPLLKRTRVNTALVFSIEGRVPVRAASDGTVREVLQSYDGLVIILDHAGGYESEYGHLTEASVAPGMSIRQGSIIGYVDGEACAELYYEFRLRGTPLDPTPFFQTSVTEED